MAGPEFFEDVLDNAARLELTVMAMPVRPLPLAALREDLCRRLGSRLGGVGCLILLTCAAPHEAICPEYTYLPFPHGDANLEKGQT